MWTAPASWTTGQIVTAANLNEQIRDNMLETSPAKASAAGDTFYATGANALARLAKGTKYQEVRMNAGETAPEWHDPNHYARAFLMMGG